MADNQQLPCELLGGDQLLAAKAARLMKVQEW